MNQYIHTAHSKPIRIKFVLSSMTFPPADVEMCTSISLTLCLPFYLPFRYYARKVLHLTKRNMCHSRHVYGAAFVQLENLHKFTLKMLSHPEASTNVKQFRAKHISSWVEKSQKLSTKHFNVYSTHLNKLIYIYVFRLFSGL